MLAFQHPLSPRGSFLESTQAMWKLVKTGCCLFPEGQLESSICSHLDSNWGAGMASRGSLRYLFMDGMLTGTLAHPFLAHLPQMPHHP